MIVYAADVEWQKNQKQVKLARFVAQWLYEQGIGYVFCVSGGASLHLIHGIAEQEGITYVPTQSEQGAGFAADAYARLNGIGCALATSGPGATNLITPIAASYYDSVPVLYLTGQVATFRLSKGVRQFGFQETPIVEMVQRVTKFAKTVMKPLEILATLQEAMWHAQEGRKGPVLVDIPDDIQRAQIDASELEGYIPPMASFIDTLDLADCSWMHELHRSKRPVLVYGWGIRLARAEDEAKQLAHRLGIPVALTWGARDVFPESDGLCVGGFGTHGTRAANFAVQNSDLVIAVGARLDTKATGSPASSFARSARIVMCDIDQAELDKFTDRKIDYKIRADARQFLSMALAMSLAVETHSSPYGGFPDYLEWQLQCSEWKTKYQSPSRLWKGVDPYDLIRQLSKFVSADDVIVCDTGFAVAWMMQAYPFKGERFIHAFNQTPMGYGLPAALGAAKATGRRVVYLAGDGSIMPNIGELATIKALDIKIIVLNNQGHGMCRQTQRQWLGGIYHATDTEHGLSFPHFVNVALANGVHGACLGSKHSEIADVESALKWLFGLEEAGLFVFDIDPEAHLQPQVKFGRPNEDAEPLLPRKELKALMKIPLLPISENA